MAGNVSFRILIAYEGFEKFDVIICARELAEPAAGQLTLESDVELRNLLTRTNPEP